MRTLRDPSLRSAFFLSTLGLSLAAGLWSTPASAQPAGADKVKYLYKAVPCTPCPCECPDRGGREPSASAMQTGPVQAPPPVSEPETAPAHPSVRTPVVAPPPPRPVDLPKGTIGGTVSVKDRGGAAKSDRSDVVVYIEQMPRKYQALKKPRSMAQRDKAFAPRMLVVTKGSTVDFPNEDKFFHNVFSLSEGNTFDLGLYRAGESKPVTFDKTGIVDVYCNIHPNMWAQILVLENPFYTTSTKDGAFEISKVPPGTYSIGAWVNGSAEPVRQQIKLEPGKRVDLQFEVQEGAAAKSHLNKFNQPYGRYK